MKNIFPQDIKFELIFQGSKDGFKSDYFHSKCDDKGRLLILIRSKEYNKVFGAYSSISLTSISGWKEGKESCFLFSLQEDKSIISLKCLDKEYEVYHNAGEILHFGIFGNLFICNDCNIK